MAAVEAATASEMAAEARAGANAESRSAAATQDDHRGQGERPRKVRGGMECGGEEGGGGGGVGVRAGSGRGSSAGGLGSPSPHSWRRRPARACI